MKGSLCIFFLLSAFLTNAQFVNESIDGPQPEMEGYPSLLASKRKLFQRNYGIIIGLQKGAATAVEFGGEAHWRKIALTKPKVVGATTNMEYNFRNHVIGYKAGLWMKRGRINFTYGGNVVYFSDFKGLQLYGVGPSIGFRLAGFHLINGYNFLAGDKELEGANTLYMSLRYYFPIKNKFTWDRKTMMKKKQKRKEREAKRERREKEGGMKQKIRDVFRF
jgi:hypothetical protein